MKKIIQSIPYETYTTIERDALTGVTKNNKINNSDSGVVNEWDGNSWISQPSGEIISDFGWSCDVNMNTIAGACSSIFSGFTGNGNTVYGISALTNNSQYLLENITIGNNIIVNGCYAQKNIVIGNNSMSCASSTQEQIIIGHNVLKNMVCNGSSIVIGNNALTNSDRNSGSVVIGNNAMFNNLYNEHNVIIGSAALYKNTNGCYNVAVGATAGSDNITGCSNVFIGNESGRYETGSNKLYISNSNTTNPLIFGDFGTGDIKINNNLTVNSLAGVSSSSIGVDTTGKLIRVSGGSDLIGSGTTSIINSGSTTIIYSTGIDSLNDDVIISKNTLSSFASIISIAGIPTILGGYDIIITLSDGIHNMGDIVDQLELRGFVGGRIILQAENTVNSPSSAQTTSINYNGSGKIEGLGLFCNIICDSIKFTTSGASQNVLSHLIGNGKISHHHCFFDFDLGTDADSVIAFLEGFDSIFDGCTFRESSTISAQNSAIVELSGGVGEGRGGRATIINCSNISNRPFLTAVKGVGEVTFKDSSTAYVNEVGTGNTDNVIVLTSQTGESTNKFDITNIMYNVSSSGVTISCKLTQSGIIYGRVYDINTLPSSETELLSGTGQIISDSGTTSGNEIIILNISGLSGTTNYKLYLYAMYGFNKTYINEYNFLTNLQALNTPVLSLVSVGDGVINVAMTDTNTSPNESGREMQYKLASSGTWLVAGTTAADATTYQYTGLTNASLYDLRCIDKAGVDAEDSVASNTIQATPTGSINLFGAELTTNLYMTASIAPFSGTNWAHSAINGGEALHTPGSTAPLVAALGTTGQTFVIQYRVGGMTVGSITPMAGTTAGTAVSANGDFKSTLLCADNGNISFVPSSDFDGYLDLISVRRVQGTPNMVLNGTYNDASNLTLPASWNVSGGTLNFDASAAYATAAHTMDVKIYNNHNYRILFDVVNGALNMEVNAGTVNIGSAIYTVESHQIDFSPTTITTPVNIAFKTNSGATAGSVDNLRVIELF